MPIGDSAALTAPGTCGESSSHGLSDCSSLNPDCFTLAIVIAEVFQTLRAIASQLALIDGISARAACGCVGARETAHAAL